MSRRPGPCGPVVAGLLLLLVGCTPSHGPTASTAATDLAAAPGVGVDRPRSPQPLVTAAPRADLVIWAPPDVAAALRPRAEDFGRTRRVSVTVESVSDVRSALQDVTAPESGPDVFLGPHTWLGEMEQQRVISRVTLSRNQQRRLAPKALAGARYDGQLWGVPYAIANLALVRNTDLAPQAPQTYEQLIANGRRLKAEGKVNRILLQSTGSTGDVYSGYPYLRAYGGGIFAKTPNGQYSPGRLVLDSPASLEGARRLAELGREGVIQPDVDNTNAVPLFGDRHGAYLVTGAWSVPVIQASGVPYAISPLPALPRGGKPVPLLDVDLFYVSATAQSPKLAQEFVRDCATRRDVQVRLARATGLPPALTAAYRDVAARDHHYAAWFDAGRDGDPVPSVPAMQAVWGPLGQAFADIVAGKDPQHSLTAAARQISSDLP